MLNFRWIDKMLRKLSSGQGRPSKQRIFGHVTSLIGENVIADNQKHFPEILHTPAKYECSIFRKISQSYCIHLPNMKRIHLMAAKLLQKENADPAESLLPYTNKRP